MRSIFLTLAALVLVAVSGCQSGEKKDNNGEQQNSADLKSGKLEIADPWIRPAAAGANTALFFEVVNGTDSPDTLYAVKSDIAEIVEVHESYAEPDGRMGMRHTDFVAVAPKSKFLFKPKGYHVMMIILKQDAKIDDVYEAALFFKRNGEIKITARVEDRMSSGMMK